MRHGKSDWSENLPDFDRPLNTRGQKDAARMGRWIKDQGLNPATVISSPAKRALHTTQLVCEQAGVDSDRIMLEDRIYEASHGDLLDVIEKNIKDSDSLLITGHNPGLDALVGYLASEEPSLSESGKLMTTAAIAVFEFADGYNGKPGSGHLRTLARPKEI